ncbi:MAG: hypothetical protein ETSY1_06585 [Candidatus Entotheonella factor]|uniref:Uncharacterized protein n=1 Tax=Entotheonella factor TaxID=1429438 RepID=W4LUL9_ENTF1|nr:hypothetical protein [Candidatus Entotheonella palauensis]ETX01683.1 MAG: hypothetical protein ETSY1_06585 [Candidatus Entotheonella factor]
MRHAKASIPDLTTPNATALSRESAAFDWTMIFLSLWLLGGAYVDGWAHNHAKVDDTFFTPWHALFYSGYLAVACYLVGQSIRRIIRGAHWRRALPPGYGWSLAGAVIFWFGGVGDLIWHTLFGIEDGVEALFSPTHLTLAVAVWLIVGGPFRAAWQRAHDPAASAATQLPMLLSATFMLSTITFIIQIAHPVSNNWMGGDMPGFRPWLYEEMGVMTFLWDTALLISFMLVLIRRGHLPPGAFTMLLTINAIGMGFLFTNQPFPMEFLYARIATGIIADLLYIWLRPSVQRLRALRSFACVVPVVATAVYVLAVTLTTGLWWSIHLWTGAMVLTGGVGLLCSYLLVLPPGSLDTAPEAE